MENQEFHRRTLKVILNVCQKSIMHSSYFDFSNKYSKYIYFDGYDYT